MSRIYSLAGSSLEQGLGKFAYRARLGSYAKAVATLLERRRITDMIRSEDMRENEKACKILLICAGYVGSPLLPFFPLCAADT